MINMSIKNNSEKFRKRKCQTHRLSGFQMVCPSSECIKSPKLSLLCNQCYAKHNSNHGGLYIVFDKIFSENVFKEIEDLESICSSIIHENKQNFYDQLDRYCFNILEDITKYLANIKSLAKTKYEENNYTNTFIELKETLREAYNNFFSKNEESIQDEDIKKYLEFYIHFQDVFEENKAKSEEMLSNIENEFEIISKSFDKKIKDIKEILELDDLIIEYEDGGINQTYLL